MKKVALVTGGSRGIGRATVLALAKNGYDVVINYKSSKEKAEEVLNLVKEYGSKGLVIKADVSKYNEVKKMVDKTIKEFGRIDVLVNNAGIMPKHTDLEEISEKEWNEVIDVNLKGAFNCCKAVVPYMIKQKFGRIVNIASLAGKGGISPPHYCASKGGMIALTYSLAYLLAKYNITVNAVAPGGIIETDMAKDMSEEQKQTVMKLTPLGRMGKPEEIAKAVLFLIEDEFVTGEVLDVNGGRYMD